MGIPLYQRTGSGILLVSFIWLTHGLEENLFPAGTGSTGPQNVPQNITSMNEIFKSCIFSSESQRREIECRVNSSGKFGSDFDAECLSPGVMRFLGEFDVLDVNCVAPFHLDFDFDGFQPTEAIKVRFWKELSPNATNRKLQASAYHLDLKIYSNAALYKLRLNQFQSLSGNTTKNETDFPKLEYPRTGRYIFRKLVHENPRLEIYFFFEEPDQDPSFMFNNFTRSTLLERGNLSIPCRPSHAGLNVNLYKKVNGSLVQIEDPEFNPWKGFEIPYNSQSKPSEKEFYECRFEDDEYPRINFTYPPTKIFGFEALPPQQYGNSKVTVNVEANAVTRKPITVNITCVILTNNDTSLLTTIGCENPIHLKLVREFILTDYSQLSYDMAATTTHVGEGYPYELKIYRALQTGITYCVSESYSRIIEYAAGLNQKVYPLDFGTDYASLPHTSPPKEVHINLEVFVTNGFQLVAQPKPHVALKLVLGTSYTFSCRIDPFTIAKTILWEIQYNDGRLKRAKVDYDFQGEFSYLNLTATEEMKRVFCSAPFWNNDKYRTADVLLAVGGEAEVLGACAIYRVARNECLPLHSWYVAEDVAAVDDRFIIVSTSFVAFVLVLSGATIFMFHRMRKSQRKRVFSKEELLEFENGNPSVKNEAGLSEGGHHLPYDKQYEIPEGSYEIGNRDFRNENVDFDHPLGSGEFGVVYKGLINGDRTVAAKTVKPNVDKSFVKALLSELKIMIYLGKHEHTIEFVGASTTGLRQGSVFLFLELCSLGSLENFLRAHRQDLQPEDSPYTQFAIMSSDEMELSEASDVSLTMKDLFMWSYQIAQGMEFLSMKNVIHGDLATRNVLLTENKVAKICDFGLSRRLHNYRIYAKNPSDQPLPWPWMAPESLRNLTFSTQTDVWAFGITVWEIFSLGELPYPGMSPGLDFLDKLRNGLRNIQTKLMPDNMYKEVVKECWRYHPEDRPNFNELCFTLESIYSSFSESRNQSMSSDSGVNSSPGGYVVHTLTYGIT